MGLVVGVGLAPPHPPWRIRKFGEGAGIGKRTPTFPTGSYLQGAIWPTRAKQKRSVERPEVSCVAPFLEFLASLAFRSPSWFRPEDAEASRTDRFTNLFSNDGTTSMRG